MKKGLFITLEGGEGAGKTTLVEKIKKHLLSKNLNCIVTREPGSTKLGEEIRDLLLKKRQDKMSAKAELCLFLAARAQHIEDIIDPSLKKGIIVLCDRYNDSSIAYQGFARNLGLDEVIKFSSFIVDKAIPDLTLYLDIDPKIGLSRVKQSLDRIESEKITFHQKIRKGFFILSKKYPDRIKILDAQKLPDEVFKNAINYIDKIIK